MKEQLKNLPSEEELAQFLKHEWKELVCIDECYMERLAKAIHQRIGGQ